MKINHTATHYLLAAVALSGVAVSYDHHPKEILVPTAVTQQVTNIKVGAHDWPILGEEKTIRLGEAFNTVGNKIEKDNGVRKVTLFCSSISCMNLRNDVDNAFQIGWWDREFEDRFVDSEAENGISVGPPGKFADQLALEIGRETGVQVKTVPITKDDGSPIDGLGVIFGKIEVR